MVEAADRGADRALDVAVISARADGAATSLTDAADIPVANVAASAAEAPVPSTPELPAAATVAPASALIAAHPLSPVITAAGSIVSAGAARYAQGRPATDNGAAAFMPGIAPGTDIGVSPGAAPPLAGGSMSGSGHGSPPAFYLGTLLLFSVGLYALRYRFALSGPPLSPAYKPIVPPA